MSTDLLVFLSLSQYFEGVVPLSSGLRVLRRTQIIFVSCHLAYRNASSPPLAAFYIFSFLLAFSNPSIVT